MRLENKVAIVTGAGSGNGAAIAKGFLDEGAKVVYADINRSAALKEAQDSGHYQNRYLVIETDVSDRESVQRMVEKTISTFSKVDVMVANAGINIRKPFLELSESDFEKVMSINAKGVFLCSQEAAKIMVETGGSIIHMSSITSQLAEPDSVQYGASKGAVGSMTRHMAMDLGIYNIRVNAIAPGTIKTKLTAARLEQPGIEENEAKLTMLNRTGRTKDLIGAAVLLASEESAFITGTHIFIDGGYSFK